MTVIVLSSCPVGLRGFLSRWLMEISAGVFVGVVSARIRDEIWDEVRVLCKDGRAILVHSARNEQRMKVRVHRHPWLVKDFDGISLMSRPRSQEVKADSESNGTESTKSIRAAEPSGLRPGWSNMSKFRHRKR
ncbi:type I-E CRISPR-associated endoribonuclease Cas2e [Glutamicibacter sp. NPDC087344]|uniref:type I-E CRISPR-associated endoribonuclease Cas2e n=1 Tax=Glutamicibacter sp. NPDC087344 TaxID=3363994 RepID=UPI0037FFDF4E